MSVEVKYLADGSPVLVVGEGPTRTTSLDGGRTEQQLPQLAVVRLDVEHLEADAVHDSPPDLSAAPQPGDPTTAEALDAEIERLRAQREQLGGGQ